MWPKPAYQLLGCSQGVPFYFPFFRSSRLAACRRKKESFLPRGQVRKQFDSRVKDSGSDSARRFPQILQKFRPRRWQQRLVCQSRDSQIIMKMKTKNQNARRRIRECRCIWRNLVLPPSSGSWALNPFQPQHFLLSAASCWLTKLHNEGSPKAGTNCQESGFIIVLVYTYMGLGLIILMININCICLKIIRSKNLDSGIERKSLKWHILYR